MTLSGTPQITYTENYSACKAPTSINFTSAQGSSIVKPGDTLTISWSGADGGTNNAISGYDIYYKIGSAPTTSSYTDMASVSSTSTSSSKSFTVPSSASNNRGNAFYAMVRTKGAAGASYYSGWKESNGGKVNSLPGAPTIVADKSRIFSTGTTRVTFTTVTAGTDNDTG
jgi:Developmentally Regulated MAPK Interacting Protein.